MVVELMKTSILFPRVANTMVKNPKNGRIFPAFAGYFENKTFFSYFQPLCVN